MNNSIQKKEFKKILKGYFFIFPMIIGLLVFNAIPFGYSLYLAMTDANGLNTPQWIGLQNFAKMFRDETFWTSLIVTLKFTLIQVPLRLAFSLFVAMLLSRKTKGIGIYRVAFYVPSVLGGSVAIAMTWKILWSNNGVINSLLSALGLETVNWLKNPSTALYVLILLGVWQFGSAMLVFLNGLNDIPQEYYEAARVDGANGWERLIKITIPLLTPSIFFNLINGMIGALQAFNSAYLVTAGGPVKSTLYYSLNVYNQAFEYGKFGYASALAWFMLIIIVILTMLIFKSSAGWVYYRDEQE